MATRIRNSYARLVAGRFDPAVFSLVLMLAATMLHACGGGGAGSQLASHQVGLDEPANRDGENQGVYLFADPGVLGEIRLISEDPAELSNQDAGTYGSDRDDNVGDLLRKGVLPRHLVLDHTSRSTPLKLDMAKVEGAGKYDLDNNRICRVSVARGEIYGCTWKLVEPDREGTTNTHTSPEECNGIGVPDPSSIVFQAVPIFHSPLNLNVNQDCTIKLSGIDEWGMAALVETPADSVELAVNEDGKFPKYLNVEVTYPYYDQAHPDKETRERTISIDLQKFARLRGLELSSHHWDAPTITLRSTPIKLDPKDYLLQNPHGFSWRPTHRTVGEQALYKKFWDSCVSNQQGTSGPELAKIRGGGASDHP